MSDEIEKRLAEIERRRNPHNRNDEDLSWLITTVREQMARAERAGAKLATTSHFLVEADSDNRIIRGERDEFLARAETADKACAAMRAALEQVVGDFNVQIRGGRAPNYLAHWTSARAVLATDAGKDWVPRALLDKQVETTQGAFQLRDRACEERDKLRAESQQHFDAAAAMRALLDASEKENWRLRAELEVANERMACREWACDEALEAERRRCAQIVREFFADRPERAEGAVRRILEGK